MRWPNPWIAVPALLATVAGAVIGFQVTRVSCAPGSCLPAAAGIGAAAALMALFGVGAVMILAVRSIAEWREQQERGDPPRPTETTEPPTC